MLHCLSALMTSYFVVLGQPGSTAAICTIWRIHLLPMRDGTRKTILEPRTIHNGSMQSDNLLMVI